jgi:hypothetical protein
MTASRKAGERKAALACVDARVTAVGGSSIRRLINGICRGGVVMSWRGPLPEPPQHLECQIGVAPFGELVAPGRLELRPAQLLRVLRREGIADRAVLPFKPAARRHPQRAFLARVDVGMHLRRERVLAPRLALGARRRPVGARHARLRFFRGLD